MQLFPLSKYFACNVILLFSVTVWHYKIHTVPGSKLIKNAGPRYMGKTIINVFIQKWGKYCPFSLKKKVDIYIMKEKVLVLYFNIKKKQVC